MSDETRNPAGRDDRPETAAELHVGAVDASPGRRTRLVASLTNRSEAARSFALAVHGFEEGWVELPGSVGPIEPGATAEVRFEIRLPAGHPACTLVGTLVAGDGTEAARADVVVTVADGSVVHASLDPAETRARRRGRFEVVLRNRGQASTRVTLEATAADPEVQVRFADPEPMVPPGRELRVAGRVQAPRVFTGTEHRRPFGVRVQARSTPFVLEGSLLQRPFFQGSVLKVTAIVCVVALWAAAAVVGIGALNTHFQKNATAKAASSSPTGPSASPSGGPGSGGGSGGGSSTGASSPSGGSGGSAGGTVRVGGKVSAAQPGGVTVTVTPTSLSDASSSGATVLSAHTVSLTSARFTTETAGRASAPLGKVYGTAVPDRFDAGLTAVAGVPTMATRTAPDGSWAIGGLKAPGTYLVTFSKPGFATRKYLLTATSPGKTLQLDATISPGYGSIAGSVTGPGGALGGVSLTLTDGTVTLTTRTPSVGGQRGKWSLTGLTTPDTYLVTATKPGYGTATTLVKLTASGSTRGVRLQLKPGVGTITGTVLDERAATGIGGVTVTATGGSTTESATTTTQGKVGSYTLPNLPIPGTYALTFSGPGWVTQTREVHLRANAVVGASLVSSGADVVGFAYDKASNGLSAAGVILKSSAHTFKTLTQSTAPVGRFDFNQVPAGTYVLTIEDYGYQTESAQVVVTPGGVTTKSLVLPAQAAQNLDTGTIRGTVNDLFDAKGVAGVPLTLDGKPAGESGTNGAYQMNDVAPGVHVVSAAPSTAQGFEPASVQVNVPLGGTAFAPVLNLPKLDTLAGMVKSAADGKPVSGATVRLFPPDTATAAAPTAPTVTGTATTAAPVPTGGALATATTTSSGTYSFKNLKSGNYQLAVSAAGFEATTLDISLAADQSLNQNVSLILAPNFNVVTYAQASNGGVQQVGGVCVTVTGPGYSKTELSSATEPVTFTPLVDGQAYKATFWQPSGTATSGTVSGVPASPCPQNQAESGTAPSTTFTAHINNTSIYSAFIAPQLPAVSVSLTFRYELQGSSGSAKTVDCPAVTKTGAPSAPAGCPILAKAPSVSITGITSFTATSNGSLGRPVYSQPIAAVSPAGTTSDTWSFTPSALSALVSNQVTLTIDGSGTALQSASPSETLSGGGPDTLQLVLAPTPVKVTGTVAPAGATLSVDPHQIPVSTEQNALGAPPQSGVDAIDVSSNAGTLEWVDTELGAPGLAQPGVYTVSATSTGYEDASTTVTPGVSGGVLTGAPVSLALSLTQETTLTVSAANYNDYPASAGLPGPTVTLLYEGKPVTASNGGPMHVRDEFTGTTTAGNSVQLAGPVDSAVFTYLSPSAESAAPKGGGYEVVVTAPGYQAVFDDLTSGLTSTQMTLTPSPLEESVITGSVSGTIDGSAASPLAGVAVTATLSGTCPAPPANTPPGYTDTEPATVSATTGADGTFFLAGNVSATDVNGGLCPGATYTLKATLKGYTSASTPSATLATGQNTASALQLAAQPMTQEIQISPVGGGAFSSNAEPSLSVSDALGANFVCNVGAASGPCLSATATATGADFKVQVYPTAYNYTMSAPNYVPLYLSAISYAPGSSPAVLSEILQRQMNDVVGTVTEAPQNGASGSTKPVPGLLLDLASAANPGTTLTSTATTTSGSKEGSFSIPNVESGTYDLNPAAGTGYVAVSGSTFSTAYPSLTTTANLSVQATAPTTFEVDLASTATSATDLSGASVTLTPTTAPSPLPSGTSSCVNNASGAQPLLVAGFGQTLSGQEHATTGGGVAFDFTQPIPDFYDLSVSGPGMPPQATTPIEICPTTSASTLVSTTYTVQQAEIAGALTLTDTAVTTGTPLTATATVSVASSTVTSTASVTGCNAGEPCNYSIYLALGPKYTTTASAPGYPHVTPPSVKFTPTASNASDLTEDFKLSTK